MALSKVFISEVFKLVTDRLLEAGFTKRKLGLFSCDVNAEISGWLGLNKALDKAEDVLYIGPVVGVRHHRLETLVDECLGLKPGQNFTASVATNVGYLMPANEYFRPAFSPDADPRRTADALVDAVVRFGIPFMNYNSSLRSLYATLSESSFGIPHVTEYRLPVAAALLGLHAESEALLDSKLMEIRDRDDLAAHTYRSFALRVRAFVSAHANPS